MVQWFRVQVKSLEYLVKFSLFGSSQINTYI